MTILLRPLAIALILLMQNPADKRMPEQRLRIAWAETIPATGPLFMPLAASQDVSVTPITLAAKNSGRGATAPDSPPPKQA